MSRTWKIIIAATILLVILLVVAKKKGWIGSTGDNLSIEIAKVEERTIIETVTASGKIQPESEVKISSEVSGEIIELTVKEGQDVKEGDLLVRINPDLYESAINRVRAAVNSAKAAVSQSKAQLIEAEKNYNRNKKLHADKVISDAEFEASTRSYQVAKLGVDAAEFQLKSAEANEDEAMKNLKRTTIKAPASGTISKLNVELGERVVGTAQMTGTEMLRLANLESMEVIVDVNENEIVRIHIGDTAIVEVDAYLNDKFKGIVTEIANSANTTGTSVDQVTTFSVKIRILKSSYEKMIADGQNPFRPGMTATVDIRTRVVKKVPTVPIAAVTTRSDTSATSRTRSKKSDETETDSDEQFEVVFVKEGDKARIQVVKTGVQDDKFIQILEGLKPGEEIISGPYDVVSRQLNNGSSVKVESGKKEIKTKE